MSDFVFRLVHSLTTSEKVYFKRQTKIHAGKESKNYLKLYDAISEMTSFDKNLLKAKIEGTTINKYLSSEVDYLNEKLLLSLFNFNLNRTKRNKIQKGILIIETLSAKGFRKEALKKLTSIKKSAFKQEEFTWVLRLIEMEEIILFKEGIIGYKDKLKDLLDQRNMVTNKIQNLNDYHILREEVRELQFSESIKKNPDKVFGDLDKNPLVANSENCQSIKANEHWYYLQVLLNYLKRDFKNGLTISADYVVFMYKNMHLFDLSKILPGLSNYIYHAALTSDKTHFKMGQEMLLKLSGEKELSKSYLDYILFTRNLEFAYYAKDTKLSKRYIQPSIDLLDSEIQNFEEAQIQYIFMLIVRAAILQNDYKLAIHHINLWFQYGVIDHRKIQARLFSIMIHFVLNYNELVLSEMAILKKLERNSSRDKTLMRIFYRYMNAVLKHPERKAKLTTKFQEELKILSKDKGYFDFLSFDYHEWSLRLS
jgi:hypothetical protein